VFAIIKKLINFILELNKEFFQVSLTAYLVFSLIEKVKSGFISLNFNLDIILRAVIISGLLTIFSRINGDKIIKQEVSKTELFFVLLIIFLGGFFVFGKTKELSWPSWYIALLSFLSLSLFATLIVKNDEGK